MRLQARAKINWTLDIIGRREDGYHLMDMLMQPVTLCDEVTLLPADEVSLTTGGSPLLPADESHLALRAARALKAASGCPLGAQIHVEKRIPVGAGMGGGSADAAAVLAGLNRLWGLGLTQEELERIGLTLGADVPFCLHGGLTRSTGIGEKMENLPCALPWPLVVTQPCKGLSTKEIFQGYHAQTGVRRPDTSKAIQALAGGNAGTLPDTLANVLQPVSESRRPQIRMAIEALRREPGCIAALMTGSGSAVFGVFASAEAADRAYDAIRARWPRTFRCETTNESLVFENEPEN